MLADFWRMEKEITKLDHYHWIDEEGLFDVSEWRTVALLVWPEVVRQRITKDDAADDEI